MFYHKSGELREKFFGLLNQTEGACGWRDEILRQGGGGDEHVFKFRPLGSLTKGLPAQPHPKEPNHHSIKIKRHQLFTILCNFILTKP
jgi:hypothetical protein